MKQNLQIERAYTTGGDNLNHNPVDRNALRVFCPVSVRRSTRTRSFCTSRRKSRSLSHPHLHTARHFRLALWYAFLLSFLYTFLVKLFTVEWWVVPVCVFMFVSRFSVVTEKIIHDARGIWGNNKFET